MTVESQFEPLEAIKLKKAQRVVSVYYFQGAPSWNIVPSSVYIAHQNLLVFKFSLLNPSYCGGTAVLLRMHTNELNIKNVFVISTGKIIKALK